MVGKYFTKIKELSVPALIRVVYWRVRKRCRYRWRKMSISPALSPLLHKGSLPKAFLDNQAQGLSKYVAARRSPRFFWRDRELGLILDIMRRDFADSVEQTVKAADRVCQNEFDLLGSGPTILGEGIDWDRDFKSGIGWKRDFYLDIEKIRLNDNSDIKVPWELSRFQHAILLGKAYLYTNNEKYPRKFVSQVSDWVDDNPFMMGVNWINAMEVAIRAVNWIFGLYLLVDSHQLTNRFMNKFLNSLEEHGRFIFRNLELRRVYKGRRFVRANGNHYLADIVGLLYLGLLFPEFREAERWRRLAVSELFRETLAQNNEDGVNYELSIGYHRFVAEMCLSSIVLCMMNDIEVPAAVLRRIEKMIEFTASYTRPDGLAPLLGDSDDGRLHILSGKRLNDHRHLLALGAVVFERPDLKAASADWGEEVLWLLGPEGYKRFRQFPGQRLAPTSKAFPESGFYVMRQGDHYTIITCTADPMNGTGGSHVHNDALSFELAAFGETIISDSGTFTYSGDIKWRNRFRSTMAHNVIMIDGEEINRFSENQVFGVRNEAKPLAERWESSDCCDIFEGSQFGYLRLPGPVKHTRRIFFDKSNEYWLLEDMLEGEGIHKIEALFHLFPGCSAVPVEGNAVVAERNGKVLMFCPVNGQWELRVSEDRVSLGYGMQQESKTLRYTAIVSMPFSSTFLLRPLDRVPSYVDPVDLQVRLEDCFRGISDDQTATNHAGEVPK